MKYDAIFNILVLLISFTSISNTFQILKLTLLIIFRSSPKEALLLSAQSTNEIIAIYNKWVSDTPPACCSPVSVPNRTDTKFEGRMNGVISSPLLENK